MPQPEGPTIARFSPAPTERSTGASATRSPNLFVSAVDSRSSGADADSLASPGFTTSARIDDEVEERRDVAVVVELDLEFCADHLPTEDVTEPLDLDVDAVGR